MQYDLHNFPMKDDLNSMISDSLRIFPNLCKPLSDIVFAKTEGNPFFALEFLRSLFTSRLLEYSLRERRWIWDESQIRSEQITDNVLYLLSVKMNLLPKSFRAALKVVSCFGIKVDETIVAYLMSTSQYSDLGYWLNKAIEEGCMHKVGTYFKFVHDKVMEAAYSLIADHSKTQASTSPQLCLGTFLLDVNYLTLVCMYFYSSITN